MAVDNPSFETTPSSATPWEASSWVYSSSAACRIAGFGENEDPWDLFTWSPFISDVSTWVVAAFHSTAILYEDFDFGGLIDEWSPGWVGGWTEDFEWAVWNPVFTPGLFSGYEAFLWSAFSDVFVPGAVALFDAGTLVYEEFESW